MWKEFAITNKIVPEKLYEMVIYSFAC